MFEEFDRVCGIVVCEKQGDGGQCRSGLGCEVGTGIGSINFEGGARHRHRLSGAPVDVVAEAVADLPEKGERRAIDITLMATHEVVRTPSKLIEQCGQLPRLFVGSWIFNSAPREHGQTVGHGQAEFHVVARIVEASGKIKADIAAVAECGVAAPAHTKVRRQVAGALHIVKVERLLQDFGVVVVACLDFAQEHIGGIAVVFFQSDGDRLGSANPGSQSKQAHKEWEYCRDFHRVLWIAHLDPVEGFVKNRCIFKGDC